MILMAQTPLANLPTMGSILNPFLFIFFGRLLFLAIVEILLSNSSLEKSWVLSEVTVSGELNRGLYILPPVRKPHCAHLL